MTPASNIQAMFSEPTLVLASWKQGAFQPIFYPYANAHSLTYKKVGALPAAFRQADSNNVINSPSCWLT